ncbi:excalibur calcium-binding domain-containing protein [Motilibacter aurantiacus]|uniref:excalibur calcium-binding domain-containing protein n=1 Tax=Motilibacter aurantiacus TaxID=2714955 RepID=UPI00140D74F0|nr:excalibur calcium-binding domain-containing protein [Motilibacter aurantiacus]NHC46747.1 excalibur calcium-binding domain-containing protein [Motilibacter aurantiacus]
MRKLTGTVLALVVGWGGAAALPAEAAARAFDNCSHMHTVYKGGVAKKGAKDKRRGGGRARYAPKVSDALYAANRSMDRDKDGIACEK